MRKIILFLVLVFLVAAGFAVYLRFFKNQPLPKNRFTFSSQIGTPEYVKNSFTFPIQIGTYNLLGDSVSHYENTECPTPTQSSDTQVEGINIRAVCFIGSMARYRNNTDKSEVHVQLMNIKKGKEIYEEYFDKYGTRTQIKNVPFIRVESKLGWWAEKPKPHSLLGWWAEKPKPHSLLVTTQEYTFTVSSDGKQLSYHRGTGTGENPVTQYFLEKYPPED